MSYYHLFCVRDQVKSIDEVMKSVLSQTIPPKKIMIVNDGSTDGTRAILERYAETNPDLIKLFHTDSKTRDFSRIPRLWNMCLLKEYDYQWIGAGDNIVEPDYAEKILKDFEQNPTLVICSGDTPPYKMSAPLGGGRFIKQSFFYKFYDKYIEKLGYESEILYKAQFNNFQTKVNHNAKLIHAQALGVNHNFKEFGTGMRTLGYYPLYVLGRFLMDFFYKDTIGKKAAVKMLFYYLTFIPKKTGYYSNFDKDTRALVKESQKLYIEALMFKLRGKIFGY